MRRFCYRIRFGGQAKWPARVNLGLCTTVEAAAEEAHKAGRKLV